MTRPKKGKLFLSPAAIAATGDGFAVANAMNSTSVKPANVSDRSDEHLHSITKNNIDKPVTQCFNRANQVLGI